MSETTSGWHNTHCAISIGVAWLVGSKLERGAGAVQPVLRLAALSLEEIFIGIWGIAAATPGFPHGWNCVLNGFGGTAGVSPVQNIAGGRGHPALHQQSCGYSDVFRDNAISSLL